MATTISNVGDLIQKLQEILSGFGGLGREEFIDSLTKLFATFSIPADLGALQVQFIAMMAAMPTADGWNAFLPLLCKMLQIILNSSAPMALTKVMLDLRPSFEMVASTEVNNTIGIFQLHDYMGNLCDYMEAGPPFGGLEAFMKKHSA